MKTKVSAGLLLAAIAVLALGSMSSATGASVTAAGKCSANYRLGSTYITSLSTRGVKCAKGKSVVSAYHACRKRKGTRGRCASAAGYSCSEGKRRGISTQYSARAVCKKGDKRVAHKYTQNT
jgi:hypothetical protein